MSYLPEWLLWTDAVVVVFWLIGVCRYFYEKAKKTQ